MPRTAAPAPPNGPKRQEKTRRERAEARPDAILDAALEEFMAKGFDAARVEDVAKRAAVSKGAVYLYFDNKLALLVALIRREVAPVAQFTQIAADSLPDDPEKALRVIAHRVAHSIAEARVFAAPRLVISISNRVPEIVAVYREEVVNRVRKAVVSIVQKGVAQGRFRQIDPEIAIRAIIGPFLFEALWRHVLGGKTRDLANLVDGQVDFVLRGLKP
jgi:AcrR family transcriptional regulator